ncbi:MAG: hypothetical protein L0154_29055 [Chloroflexi bacterium]|nr:hypothetical protein [Chloroflexota bacterium]
MATTLKHLQALLDFTDADLAANRRGKLSHDQIDYLKRKASHERNAVLLIPSALLIGMLTLTDFWLALPAILISLLILATLIGFYEQHLLEIKDQRVLSLSGRLNKVSHTHTVTHFAIEVNGERFVVDRDFYYQIVEGEYTLYLLEETREILGVEPGKARSTSTTKKAASPTKSSLANKKPVAKPKTTQTKSSSLAKPAATADKPARPKYSSRSKSA